MDGAVSETIQLTSQIMLITGVTCVAIFLFVFVAGRLHVNVMARKRASETTKTPASRTLIPVGFATILGGV